jgi:hypothetical protein
MSGVSHWYLARSYFILQENDWGVYSYDTQKQNIASAPSSCHTKLQHELEDLVSIITVRTLLFKASYKSHVLLEISY